MMSVSDHIIELELNLVDKLKEIDYGPKVEYIYNPLSYAQELHQSFIKKYCTGRRNVMFLGMNPGPWGMMQNGIPFGEVQSVKGFLQINGCVNKPEKEHPSRPVMGLDCQRSEISGKRFWSLAQVLGAGDPQIFFKHAYVHNYFPFCLLDSKGRNITPPELKRGIQKLIEIACDESLYEVIKLLQIKVIIGIGRFAEKRARSAVHKFGLGNVKVVFISHPSPRNPASNVDWLSTTKQLLIELDISKYF